MPERDRVLAERGAALAESERCWRTCGHVWARCFELIELRAMGRPRTSSTWKVHAPGRMPISLNKDARCVTYLLRFAAICSALSQVRDRVDTAEAP